MFYFLMFYCFLCAAWGGMMYLCNKIYDLVEKRRYNKWKRNRKENI